MESTDGHNPRRNLLFLEARTFPELKSIFDSTEMRQKLSADEAAAVIAYIGACEVRGEFVHPSKLLASGSELTSPEDTLHLVGALWKLGFNPTILR